MRPDSTNCGTVLKILLFLLPIIYVTAFPQNVQSGEDLDDLIKEFIEDTNRQAEKSEESQSKDIQNMMESKRESNFIPLNAQTKFLKNEKCNCTKFFMCDVEEESEEEDEESAQGADVSMINIRLNAPEGGCSHYLDICCEKLKQKMPETGLPKQKQNTRVCGTRNVGGVGFRIVDNNDNEAQFGEFAWMAALLETRSMRYPDETPTSNFVCGASLIHPRVILSAAHCFLNKSTSALKVRLGEWDTKTNGELFPHKDIEVEKIIMHEDFRFNKSLANDIGLAILKEEAELAPNISPICLPPTGMNLDGQRCFASGWGKNEFGRDGAYQSILKRVDLPIVPRSKCERDLRDAKLGKRFKLHQSFICAGGEIGKDTCKGDGGSPLACQVPGTDYYVQYGIVSWGIGCASTVPGVYVNVPNFTPWIEEKLKSHGLDTKWFQP